MALVGVAGRTELPVPVGHKALTREGKLGGRGLQKGNGELQSPSNILKHKSTHPSFLAFCLFDSNRAGSMIQGDNHPDVIWDREEEKK